MGKVPLIGSKKINATIISEVVSTSGKYNVFLAVHFQHGEKCFDVGTFNTKDGSVVRRHYSSQPEAIAYHAINPACVSSD